MIPVYNTLGAGKKGAEKKINPKLCSAKKETGKRGGYPSGERSLQLELAPKGRSTGL